MNREREGSLGAGKARDLGGQGGEFVVLEEEYLKRPEPTDRSRDGSQEIIAAVELLQRSQAA